MLQAFELNAWSMSAITQATSFEQVHFGQHHVLCIDVYL